MIKIGLIGCGGMGTTHNLSLKALAQRKDIEVAALADCRDEFLERAAAHWPNARRYTRGMELLRHEQLDVADICLPSHEHTGHAVAAMEKGMHVFIEKPVCLTREEGQLLLDTQQKTGREVMVGQVLRSAEEYLYLKDVYEKNAFGALKSIVMQRIGGDVPWGYEDWFHDEAKSGSVVLDLHVHDLDFLRYMLGEPDDFTCRATAFESGMINQIITCYQFGRVFATAEGIWNVSQSVPFEASYRACFEQAAVVWQSRAEHPLTVYHRDGTISHPQLRAEYAVQDHSAGINISNLGPYYAELLYFVECLEQNAPVTRAPLCEAVKSVRLALRERAAAKKYLARFE